MDDWPGMIGCSGEYLLCRACFPQLAERAAMPRPILSLVCVARPLLVLLIAYGLAACSLFGERDQLSFQVVGIEPLRGEELEVRLAVKLRIQNPTSDTLDYDGVALKLRINDKVLARGVSRLRGQVPSFGETLLEVPVSVSVFAVAREALGLAGDDYLAQIPYELSGKLGGRSFSDTGVLNLSRLAAIR